MRDWILSWLGITGLIHNANNLVVANRDEVQYLRLKLQDKDEEIQRLTNIILKAHGVIPPEASAELAERPEPIVRHVSWSARQRALELADKKIADEKESYWLKKNAEAEKEIEDNAIV